MKYSKHLTLIFTALLLSTGLMSQNVGIGTFNPLFPLQINDNTKPGPSYINISTNGVNQPPAGVTRISGIQFKHFNLNYGFTLESREGTSSSGLVIKSHSNSPDGIERFYIHRSTGNVGIGTTEPIEKLDVIGGIKSDSIDVNSGRIKNVSDPVYAQDAATKAYVDLLEKRLSLLTNAPIAEDDDMVVSGLNPFVADVLHWDTPDHDPDHAFRYGNFVEIKCIGSTPGSDDNLSTKGRPIALNNNGTPDVRDDDFIDYTPSAYEIDTFYYILEDLDGLRDTALVELKIFKTVQERLDEGETPFEIYTSSNTFLDSLYGKNYQGGLIAYLNTTTGAGLIAAPSDLPTAEWGCYGTSINGTSSSLETGQTNTTLIVNGCADIDIAAKKCDDLDNWGYEDWFLPSKAELNQLFLNLYSNGFGNFNYHTYWTSTQNSNGTAWTQRFPEGFGPPGSQGTKAKYESLKSRPVRAF